MEQKLEDWKETVKNSFRKWKKDVSIHQDVENYFNTIEKSELGKFLKQDSKAFIEKFRNLGEDLEKLDEKDISAEFLQLQIHTLDANEEEVKKFVKETILADFKEEFSKLFDSAETSFGDVLKAILKEIQNFLEAGLKRSVKAIGQVVAEAVAWLFPLPDYVNDKETGVLSIRDWHFTNFGGTVKNVPSKTFFPKTLEEIQDLVKYAKKEGKRLRAAGMRHSWPSLFSNDNELLLCLLPLAVTDFISYARLEL